MNNEVMVGAGGFEPPKAEPTGLQPVPFGRSGTPPGERHCSPVRKATDSRLAAGEPVAWSLLPLLRPRGRERERPAGRRGLIGERDRPADRWGHAPHGACAPVGVSAPIVAGVHPTRLGGAPILTTMVRSSPCARLHPTGHVSASARHPPRSVPAWTARSPQPDRR